MRRVAFAALLILTALYAPARAQEVCVEPPRPDPATPALELQRQMFGFHDEEIVVCSPGFREPTHIAARLWVPQACPGAGGCPGILIAHGYGFSKEITFADMLNAVDRGLYVLSYDVRGQGSSGGQATFLEREDVADQAAVLEWFHRAVRPSKTAVYGISQGGWLALAAAIFNCGAARAGAFGSAAPCDTGGRWVDAVVPVEGPTDGYRVGLCSQFGFSVFVESRAYPGFLPTLARCAARGTPAAEAANEAAATIDAPLGPMDLNARLGRVDVPVYLATSFADRLVVPNIVTAAYGILGARRDDPSDAYKEDLRLLISNESHGNIGGNLAATNDFFTWIDRMLRGKGPQRAAPVAIAQEWAEGAFRLERGWPIPGTTATRLYLSRGTTDAEAQGHLTTKRPRVAEPADRLDNVPAISSPPGAPIVDQAWQNAAATGIPGLRLTYASAPAAATIEVTDVPEARLWVSSSTRAGAGFGQVHVALHEVRPDGSVTEFARGRRILAGLGPDPIEIRVPLTVSAYRIAPGGRLLLSIMPSDAVEALPEKSADSLYVHHGSRTPSSLVLRLAPVGRKPPPGTPPTGPASANDPIGAFCAATGLPC